MKFPLDVSIKRSALAGTPGSEEYHLYQLRQSVSVGPFSLSRLEKMIFMYRPELTLQLPQNQTVL